MKSFEPQKMMGQFVDFQKSAFDNTYEALTKIQEQSEKVLNLMTTGQMKPPEESMKFAETWKMAFKKQQAEFKSAVDSGFEKLKSFYEDLDESAKAKPKAKTAK